MHICYDQRRESVIHANGRTKVSLVITSVSWHEWLGIDVSGRSKIPCKIYTNFILNLPKFLKNFLNDFQNFHEIFPIIPVNFFQNFNIYYSSKLKLFSNFRCIFSTVPQSLIDILSVFLQISQTFFQRFSQSLYKVTVEVCPHFYCSLENFHAVFLNTQIIFLKKLIVVNFFCLSFILCFIKLYLQKFQPF